MFRTEFILDMIKRRPFTPEGVRLNAEMHKSFQKKIKILGKATQFIL